MHFVCTDITTGSFTVSYLYWWTPREPRTNWSHLHPQFSHRFAILDSNLHPTPVRLYLTVCIQHQTWIQTPALHLDIYSALSRALFFWKITSCCYLDTYSAIPRALFFFWKITSCCHLDVYPAIPFCALIVEQMMNSKSKHLAVTMNFFPTCASEKRVARL